MAMTRRRLIAISAALVVLPSAARATPPTTRQWTGQALGARASIRLAHPDGESIAARVMTEIDRLEDILSLYRAESALSRLNREGYLAAPPFELLECLSFAGVVHHASGGRFDPTVQPLWLLWAGAAASGGRPDARAIETARQRTGWDKVELDAAAITMQPGMALTLNGIGQGYVADQVAALLEAEGLTDILIDTGELRALGGRPGGGEWPIRLETGERRTLRERGPCHVCSPWNDLRPVRAGRSYPRSCNGNAGTCEMALRFRLCPFGGDCRRTRNGCLPATRSGSD